MYNYIFYGKDLLNKSRHTQIRQLFCLFCNFFVLHSYRNLITSNWSKENLKMLIKSNLIDIESLSYLHTHLNSYYEMHEKCISCLERTKTLVAYLIQVNNNYYCTWLQPWNTMQKVQEWNSKTFLQFLELYQENNQLMIQLYN